MKESNRVKYYVAKFALLVFGSLQVLAAVLMFTQLGDNPKNKFASFTILTVGLIFISFHLLISDRVKRVAIGKKKIAVLGLKKSKRYSWNDVKEIKYMPFLNMYSLKFKKKKNSIFFFSDKNAVPEFALFFSAAPSLRK